MSSFQRIKRSQKRVRGLLKQGKFDDYSFTRYGRLGPFFDFMFRLGIITKFKHLKIKKRKNGIDIRHLGMLWIIKAVLGIPCVDNMKALFHDYHLMRLCGFTKAEIENGYSRRTRKDGAKPIHTDSIRNFATSLPLEVSEGFFMDTVSIINKREKFKNGVFALDATLIKVTGNQFEGAELGKGGTLKQYELGYKLFCLTSVEKGKEYIICAKLMPASVNEAPQLLTMVEKAVAVLGTGVIKTLLVDRGYLSGKRLYYLKHKMGIDFIVPARKDQLGGRVAERASKFFQQYKFRRYNKNVSIAACPNLTVWDTYGPDSPYKSVKYKRRKRAPFNALLVEDSARKGASNDFQFMTFLTSLPISTSDSLEKLNQIYMLYRKRWRIENNCFRELLSNWNLGRFPGGKFNTINTHLFFTLAAFNLVLFYKTKEAISWIGKSMRTVRNSNLMVNQICCFVYCGSLYSLISKDQLRQYLAKSLPP